MESHIGLQSRMQTARELDEDDNELRAYDIEHDEDTGQSTPVISQQEQVLPRDQQRKTAFYDYASEKSLSHADSKLFYQRHQIEQQDPNSSLRRAWTTSSTLDGDLSGLSRTPSLGSKRGFEASGYRSALPIGLASLDKPADAPNVQHSDLSSFDPYHAQSLYQKQEQDHKVSQRGSTQNQESKPSLLVDQGIQSGGAGIGVGAGLGGFAGSDAAVTSELNAIYTNIQKILDLRHKYIRLSLQETGDNPKDDLGWNTYPPPPDPVWDEENNQPFATQSGANSLTNSRVLSPDASQTTSSTRKPRKPGQDIGEDFEMSDLLPLPDESEMTFKLDENSVFQVYETSKSAELEAPILTIPTIRDFYIDLDTILSISSDGPTKSFAFRRLQYLEGKFNLYFLLNEYQEMADSKRVPHRDFYNVRKVDTHVHHSSCMNQKHLLRFIKSKMRKCPDEVVMYRDGKHLTLREVFESINLTAYDLSIDTLDMHVSYPLVKCPCESRIFD